MNKFSQILIFGFFLLITGIIYQNFYRPDEIGPIHATGNVLEINMRVLENQWTFEPDNIHIKPGDKVILHIFNEDSYDHGFAVEAFGVNRRLFPGRETTVEFVASKLGTFTFYCSVPCGEGHYDQTGLFIVEE
jgi:cytochrome c oxidase subunit 2